MGDGGKNNLQEIYCCFRLDEAFFNQTGLERVRVVGPEPGLLWTGLKDLDHRAGDRTVAGLVCRL